MLRNKKFLLFFMSLIVISLTITTAMAADSDNVNTGDSATVKQKVADSADTAQTITTKILKKSVTKTKKTSDSDVINTTVSIRNITGVVGERTRLTAYVKDANGAKVNEGFVTFRFNNKTLREDGTAKGSAPIVKVNVENGKASIIFRPSYQLIKANTTAFYTGTDKFNSNESPIVKANLEKRNATIRISVSPKSQDHYKIIKFTAKVTDSKTRKVLDNEKDYVVFKINGISIKNQSQDIPKPIRVAVINGVASYEYTVPGGMSGFDIGNEVRYYNVSATLSSPDYKLGTEKIANFTVKRSSVKIQEKLVRANMTSRKLRIKANIKDLKGKTIKANTQLTVKINGVTIKYKGYDKVIIKNGTIDLTYDIPEIMRNKTVNQIKYLTFVLGKSTAHKDFRTNATKLKTVK